MSDRGLDGLFEGHRVLAILRGMPVDTTVELAERALPVPIVKRYSIGEVFAGWASWSRWSPASPAAAAKRARRAATTSARTCVFLLRRLSTVRCRTLRSPRRTSPTRFRTRSASTPPPLSNRSRSGFMRVVVAT